MRGHLIMNEKERICKAVLAKVTDKYIKLTEAAKQMRVSYRQAKRICGKYKKRGNGYWKKDYGNLGAKRNLMEKVEKDESVLVSYCKWMDPFIPGLEISMAKNAC